MKIEKKTTQTDEIEHKENEKYRNKIKCLKCISEPWKHGQQHHFRWLFNELLQSIRFHIKIDTILASTRKRYHGSVGFQLETVEMF